MKKYCGNCFYQLKNCRDLIGICYNFHKWRMIEEKEKIQMTEEQALEIYNKTIEEIESLTISKFLGLMKAHNFIIKTKEEEAEEMWIKFCEQDKQDELHCIQHDVIQDLKEQIKILKGE